MPIKFFPQKTMDYIAGLVDALAGKLSTSLLKTSLTDNSDAFIASQKAVKTAVDAKVDKHVFSAVLSNLTLDGATASFFTSSFSTNQSFSISNLTVGKKYEGKMKNSHATNSITITNPNTSGYSVTGGLITMGIPAGWELPYEMLNDGTIITITFGTLAKVMG
jgi:hypothetical protein